MIGEKRTDECIYIYWNSTKEEYPIAIAYTMHSGAMIRIEAISGLLKEYSSRCDSCMEKGAHNLVRGPVEEISLKAGFKVEKDKFTFFHFNFDSIVSSIKKYINPEIIIVERDDKK